MLVSKKEILNLRRKVDRNTTTNKANITQDVFKETVKSYVPSVSANDDAFLEQLYNAFDVDNHKAIDFTEFVDGLSVFIKGTPEEKLTLSFKMYDTKHAGYLTRIELEKVLLKLSGTFSKVDQTADIKDMVDHMFRDFDINNDGRLSFEEYKLSAMKEPVIVDFLEQFLVEHHLVKSKAPSIRSHLSTNHSSSRLSVRLSQAELLEYSHQQHNRLQANNSPTRRSLSRPTSMTSLDAALTSLDNGFTPRMMT
ncbi:hypothetical protein BDB01DRAFT_839675 [Pilobolus umbonatus]|nr:hypothetical protein BDB01DRAFT_839675 [Pilobolus umbonatus]